MVLAAPDELHGINQLDGINQQPGTWQSLLTRVAAEGGTWVAGRHVERLSTEGRLVPVQRGVGLQEQFPLECALMRDVEDGQQGEGTRVVAFRVCGGVGWGVVLR